MNYCTDVHLNADSDDDEDEFAGLISPEDEKRMVYITDHYYLGWAMHAVGAAACGLPLPERTMAHMPEEWIYFIQAGSDGPIKIGYSKNPTSRFVTLQTGSAIKHHYLGNVPGSRRDESALHSRFWGEHIHGEWFNPTPDLLEYIEANRFRPETVWEPEIETVQLF